MSYDLTIIGGGPAATAAAVYAARKQLKTILIAGEFGGQSNVSTDIQNWIGTPHISGADLAKSFKTHVMEYAGEILTVKEGVLVNGIEGKAGAFSVSTSTGEKIESRSVLIATGSKRRALEIAGAKEYENKGLTYCASCDGPMFSGEDVIVIGGGNAAFETAAQLLAYCKSVTLINRSATLRADEITVAQTKKDPKFKLITEVDLVNVYGGDFVEGMTIKYADGKAKTSDAGSPDASGEAFREEKIGAKGIFVEIGQLPNSDFARNLVEVTMGGQIKIDPKTQKTSVEGVWSAGDVTDVLYHQNNIAAGDAVRALEDIYLWLHRTK